MGFKFRKSKKILPGVRLNFSKKGMGVSFGGKHARYSISPTGRRTTSFKIAPGLTYSTSSGGKKRKSSPKTRRTPSKRTPSPRVEFTRPSTPPAEKKRLSPTAKSIIAIAAGIVFLPQFLEAKSISGVIISALAIAYGVYLFYKNRHTSQDVQPDNSWVCPNCNAVNGNSDEICTNCGSTKE